MDLRWLSRWEVDVEGRWIMIEKAMDNCPQWAKAAKVLSQWNMDRLVAMILFVIGIHYPLVI